jgi:hypothetical protein
MTVQQLSGEVEVDDSLLQAVAVALGVSVAPVAVATATASNPVPSAVGAGGSLDPVSVVAAERNRIKDIRALVTQHNIDTVVANDWIDNGLTLVDARAKALDIMANRDRSTSPTSHIRMNGSVPRAQVRSAMANALLNRVQPDQYRLDEASGEFRGQALMGMISTAMAFLGESVVGKTANDLVTMAMHSTSDFPLILQEAANRVLRSAYAQQPRTFAPIATRTTADDFRAKNSLQIGGGSGLEKVNEDGEFKQGTVSESKESYRLDTFGRIFAFTRQLIINDDIGALVRFVAQIGNLAARKESDLVWALVKSNPKLADGLNVYSGDAKRKNLLAGNAVNDAVMGSLKKAHRQIVGLDGEPLNITPKFLVVNSEREVEAMKMLEIIQATQTSNVNIFARSMELIVESRLDGVANDPFYTFADPIAVPTLEYAYLSGNEGPTTTTAWGFEVDGMKLKITHDFGAGFVDHRGTAKVSGAA